MARSSVVNILIRIRETGADVLRGLGTRLGGLRQAVFSLRTALTALVAGAVAQVGHTLVRAFASSEQATIRLNAALRVTGRYSDEAAVAIHNAAQELKGLTGIDDDDIVGATASIAQLARQLNTDQLIGAQRAVIGLSHAFGMDLNQAAMLVAKTLTGEMNALGRYGIRINTAAGQQDRFNQVMRATAPLFTMAVEASRSLTGQLRMAATAFDDLKETLGQVIVETLGLGGEQNTLRDRIVRLDDSIKQNMGTWVRWGHVGVAVLGALAAGVLYLMRGFFNVGQIVGRVLRALASTAITGVRVVFNFVQMVPDLAGVVAAELLITLRNLLNLIVRGLNGFITQINRLPGPDLPLLGEIVDNLDQREADALAGLRRNFEDMERAAVSTRGEWAHAADGIRNDINDMSDGAQRFATVWDRVRHALEQPVAPASQFDTRTRGGGRNLPGGDGDPGDAERAAKALTRQAQDLARALDANEISVEQFRQRLAALVPQMLALRGALTGDALNSFNDAINNLRQTAVGVGFTFDDAGVRAVSFGEAFVAAAREAQRAAGSLNQVVADMAINTFGAFAEAVATAFAAVVDGSMAAGAAFAAAMLGALAQVAQGFGQFFLAQATASFASIFGPIPNPAGAAAAAKWTAE